MNLVTTLVAGINIGVVLGAWWATGRIHEPHESWPEAAAVGYVQAALVGQVAVSPPRQLRLYRLYPTMRERSSMGGGRLQARRGAVDTLAETAP